MKRRVTKVLNFFAFNLLFFALYLNFIHKDKTMLPAVPATQSTSKVTNVPGGQTTEVYSEKAKPQTEPAHAASGGDQTAPLKLTFN
jgi:uncharacterized membrane-anchored protein YitT (DUF2179 family)